MSNMALGWDFPAVSGYFPDGYVSFPERGLLM